MSTPRWLLAVPLALAATLGAASASSVRDQAGMFSAAAISKAEDELNRIEREAKITTTVETVESLGGQAVEDLTLEHAKRSGTRGIYVLIAKKEHKIDVKVSKQYEHAISPARAREIRNAFIRGLSKSDFDTALTAGVGAVASEVSSARQDLMSQRQAAGPPRGLPMRRGHQQGTSGLGSLLTIGLLIVGVLFVVRLIGSLFRGGQGYGAPGGMMGGRGYGPGYGGGGGGFMSSLFGGIGGALAGNWLYDQFSGRHSGGYTDSSAYGGDAAAPSDSPSPDDWSAGNNASGDWGGGDTGGGGDWGGGGGGDWGGGGGGDFGGGDW